MKGFCLFLCSVLVFMFSCSGRQAKIEKSKIDSTVSERTESVDDPKVKRVAPVYYSKGIPEKIDFDFTKMNFNMASGLIFDIMVEPEKFLHRTIKFEGQFSTSVYEGVRRFAVFSWDLAGCCPTGLEFIPSSTTDFLMNFPMEGLPITVIGRLEYGFNGVDEELYFMADEIKM